MPSDSPDSRLRWSDPLVLGILGLALGLRVAACVVWSGELTVDRDAYLGMATGIAHGNGLCSPGTTQPTAFRPPLLPWLLGGLMTILPAAFAVAAVNLAAGVATTWLAMQLACGLGLSTGPILLAGLLTAVDPMLLRYTPQPMTECLFAALTTASIAFLCRAPTANHPRLWVMAGLLTGLGVLCRPTMLPFAVLAGGVLGCWLCLHQRYWKSIAGTVLLVWLGVALAVMPWVGRNWSVFGVPLVSTTHGGYTLHLANNPEFYRLVARRPWGTTWDGQSLAAWQLTMELERELDLGPQAGEVANDRWHQAQAWQAIHADSSGFRWAMLYRLRSLWSLTPRGDNQSFPQALLWLLAAAQLAIWVFAGLGLIRLLAQRQLAGWLILTLVLSLQAIHLLYWTDGRMRSPLHPLFAVCVAVSACSRRPVYAAPSSPAAELLP